MKIRVRRLTIALAIAGTLAVATTARSSAAPINGMSTMAAVPAATTDVRYRAPRNYRDPSYSGHPTSDASSGYPTYSWGYPTYNSYWGYPATYYYYPGYTYPPYRRDPRYNAYGWW